MGKNKNSNDLVKKSDKRVKNVKQHYEKTIQKLQNKHESGVKQLKHQYDQKIRTLKQSYNMELKKLTEAHNMKTKTSEQYKHEFNKLKGEMDKQMTLLKNDYERRIKLLNAQLKQTEDSLTEHKQKFEESELQSKKMVADYVKELNELHVKYNKEINDLKDVISKSKNNLDENYNLIESLKKEIADTNSKLDTMTKTYRSDKIELEKFRQYKEDLMKKSIDVNMSHQELEKKLKELDDRKQKLVEKQHVMNNHINSYKDKKRACELAITNAQNDMELEKRKHLSIRKDYENVLNRVTVLEEALDKCKGEGVNIKQVLLEMNDRYKMLEDESKKMVEEIERLNKRHKVHGENFAHYKSETEAMKSRMEKEREKLMETLKEYDVKHKDIYNSYNSCQKNNESCIEKTDKQHKYIEKLEGDIEKLMKELNDKDKIKKHSKSLEDNISIREEELHKLNEKLIKIERENSKLKTIIKTFDDHYKEDDEKDAKHLRLIDKHNSIKKLLKELHKYQKILSTKHSSVKNDLKDHKHKMREQEDVIKNLIMDLKRVQLEYNDLDKKSSTCLYPGEKEFYEKKLNAVIESKHNLEGKLDKLQETYAMLSDKHKALETRNKNLEVIKEKYDLDMEHMEKIVKQGASLNSDLIESQNLLKKKDKQLQLLSGQLSSLVHRIKVLEERETDLQERLKVAASPDEMTSLNNKLIKCRDGMKASFIKYHKMEQMANKMEEQNLVNENKIKLVLDSLKETEEIKEKLINEQQVRMNLEEALKMCDNKYELTKKDFKTRLEDMEKLHDISKREHEQVISESNARIMELENQLKKALLLQREAAITSQSEMPSTVDNKLKSMKMMNAKLDNFESGRSELEKVSNHSNLTVEDAINALKSPHIGELENIKNMHRELIRQKESQIMSSRDQTNSTILKLLENVNQDTNPSKVHDALKQIEKNGAIREQQAMGDMLDLRAIKQKALTKYYTAKQLQWKILNNAQSHQHQLLYKTINNGNYSPSTMSNVRQLQGNINRLTDLKKSFLIDQHEEAQKDLYDQQEYIKELQSQLPKLQAIESSMKMYDFPSLQDKSLRIGNEKQSVLNALSKESTESESQKRTTNALIRKANAMISVNQDMNNEIDKWIKSPTPINKEAVNKAIQKSPDEEESNFRRYEHIQNAKNNNLNVIFHTIDKNQNPSGNESLVVSESKDEVVLNPNTPQEKKVHADEVHRNQTPEEVHASLNANMADLLRNGDDIVIITSAFNDTGSSDQVYDYLVLSQAMKHVTKALAGLNTSMYIQMVKMQSINQAPGGSIVDLINSENNMVYKNCVYGSNDCTPYKTQLTLTPDGNFNDRIKELINSVGNNSVVIVTITFENISSKIHLCGLVFENQLNINASILDFAWTQYISNSLKAPNSHIYLYFNNVVDSNNPNETSNYLKIANRVSDYLKKFKNV